MSFDLPMSHLQATPVLPNDAFIFRVGMPHLSCTGLSLNWIFRECCHRHWWSISGGVGCAPSELTDMRGDRMMASVVSATVRGALHQFREDDVVKLEVVTTPRRETGWRSSWVVQSAAGAALRIELVTTFAKRVGPTNKDLRAAELPHELMPYFDGLDAARAQVLKARGRAERNAAPEAGAPLFSLPVRELAHHNGVGLMYFANFIDPIDQTERMAIPGNFDLFKLASREVHYFVNVDAGDTLEFDCTPRVTGLSPDAEITFSTIGRRKSDQKVIVACTSTRRADSENARDMHA